MKICSVDGCGNSLYAKGFCHKHYDKSRKYGNPLHDATIKRKSCHVDNCQTPTHSHGYCRKHWRRLKNNGDPLKVKSKGSLSPYSIWRNIRYRCNNPNCKDYPRYGGRGIKVCKEWDSFEQFHKDMGDKPFLEAQIDREDNDKNYSPDNCRWTDCLTNIRNSTSSKLNKKTVNKIRNKYKTGNFTQKELSTIFGLSLDRVYLVVNNLIWEES